VLALDRQLRLHSPSQAFAQAFGLVASDLEAQPLAAISGGAWNQAPLRERLQRLFDSNPQPTDAFDDFVFEADFVGLGRRRVTLYGRRMLHQGQPTPWVLLGVRAIAAV
jgi:two-component system CheB/CheR fusion protein